MAITALPPAPSRDDPDNFSNESDAFLSALPTFATEANALQTDVNSKQSTASAAAVTASTKADEALASANAAALSETQAETAAIEAATLTEAYQGSLASDPTLDKHGNALGAGDWYVNSSTGFIRVYTGSAWVQGISSIAGVTSINGEQGVINLDKTDVGLGSVDNTSDADKPISSATATALSNKQSTLVSGTNIKTINSTSLLGSGNIAITSGVPLDVGAYGIGVIMLAYNNGSAVSAGDTAAGIRPVYTSSAGPWSLDTAAAGTWRALQYVPSSFLGMFQRIA